MLPGTPSVKRGTKEPPTQALFPASAAAIPSGLPFPNNSFVFDLALAILYDRKAAIVAPSPGMIPTIVPAPVPSPIYGHIPLGILSRFIVFKSISPLDILFSLVSANI